jgi:hypothetical protein
MSPTRAGIAPSKRLPATIAPQVSMGPGLSITARTDVRAAVETLTGRSSSSGKDTMLIASVARANSSPMPMPTPMSVQPTGVVKPGTHSRRASLSHTLKPSGAQAALVGAFARESACATTMALNHRSRQHTAQLQGALSRHRHQLWLETERRGP